MFYTDEQISRVCSAVTRKFLALADEAGLLQGDIATLAGVSRLTVNKWRVEAPTSMWASTFLNIKAATAWLQEGLAVGCFPTADRYTARLYLNLAARGAKDWEDIQRRAGEGQKNAPKVGGKEDCDEGKGKPDA